MNNVTHAISPLPLAAVLQTMPQSKASVSAVSPVVEFWVSASVVCISFLVVLWAAIVNDYMGRSAATAIAKNKTLQLLKSPIAKDANVASAVHDKPKSESTRFEPGEDEKVEAADIFSESATWSAIRGFSLPYLTLEVLGQRLEYYSPRYLYAGAPVIPAILVATFAVFFAGTPRLASASVGLTFLVLGFILLLFTFKATQGSEWRSIHDFLQHRQVKVSTKNALALVSLLATCLQLAALAMKLFKKQEVKSDSSSYEMMKLWLKRNMQMVLFDVSPILDQVDVNSVRLYASYGQVAIAFLCVALWWCLYAGILRKAILLAMPIKVTKSSIFHYVKTVRVKNAIYALVAHRSTYTTVFMLLSDTLLVSVVSGLIMYLDCWRDDSGVLRLEVDPQVECFVGQHRTVASLALACLVFYTVTAVLTAPFIVADSEGVFTSSDLDVKYEPLFDVQERLCKCALVGASVFFNHYPVIPRCMNFVGSLWLAYVTWTVKPCSVLWVNMFKQFIYQVSTMVALGVIIDANTSMEWVPFIIVVVGIVLSGAVLLASYCATTVPEFGFSEHVGETYQDSEAFTDVSILRGRNHRLAAMAVWHIQDDGVHGLQCVYHVDGHVVTGPMHHSSWINSGGPNSLIEFEEGETIVALHSASDGTDARGALGFFTSAGKRHAFGNDSCTPSTAEECKVQISEGKVIGVFGHRNGHIHTLGLIISADKMPQHTNSYQGLPP